MDLFELLSHITGEWMSTRHTAQSESEARNVRAPPLFVEYRLRRVSVDACARRI